MASKALAKAKENPGVALMITLGAVASAAIAIWNFTGVLDSAIVSESELTERLVQHSASAHAAAQVQIDAIRREGRCNSIDIQISILSEIIWRMDQDDPNSLRLVDKREEMEKLKDRRTALRCAEIN